MYSLLFVAWLPLRLIHVLVCFSVFIFSPVLTPHVPLKRKMAAKPKALPRLVCVHTHLCCSVVLSVFPPVLRGPTPSLSCLLFSPLVTSTMLSPSEDLEWGGGYCRYPDIALNDV